MVNATIDNAPVSIQLSGQSTTVPANETWKVNIGVHSGEEPSTLIINGVVGTTSSINQDAPHPPQFEMILNGGDTIEENKGFNGSMLSIQGFVVDS